MLRETARGCDLTYPARGLFPRPARRHCPAQVEVCGTTWLATSDEPEACTTGGYWYHQRLRPPHPAAGNKNFQDSLLDALARFTATPLTTSS